MHRPAPMPEIQDAPTFKPDERQTPAEPAAIMLINAREKCAAPLSGCQATAFSHQLRAGAEGPMLNELHKPVLEGKGATDYERYLRTDELLSLQTATDKLSHPDELTFQVVHQSSELLMKGASWELERARTTLSEGNYPNCARLMRRANAMLEHPISLLHVLETITPYDYHIIRSGLGHGSGLDSPGFLSLLHIAPRIGEAFQEQLTAKGLTADDIYRRHDEHFGLHDVAERM